MEASELRIGNLIQLNPNKDWYPKDPDLMNLIKSVSSICLDGINYTIDYGENPYWMPFSDICGIPLNEEWLVKFGFFDNDGGEYYHEKHDIFGVQFFDGEPKHIWDASYTSASCLHVHQLQNLYFALTGEELKMS